MMPRPRSAKNRQLPKNVYLAKGRYFYRPYLGSEGRKAIFGKEVRLCSAKASIGEVWRTYEKTVAAEIRTLSWLVSQYLNSDHIKTLAARTQGEYTRYAEQLIAHPLKTGGRFGDVALPAITKKVVRRYLDTSEHKVAANRRVQFLKAVYSWAIQRLDGVEENPCVGVDLNKEASRTRYVEDWEYEAMFMCAMDSPYPYIALMMELAYLCRQRRSEVSNRRVSEVTDRGLVTLRGKGSKGEITVWSDRLRAAVDACRAYNRDAPASLKKEDRYLIHDKWGKPIKKNAFDTAWQRVRDRAMTAGWEGRVLKESFTFHDLKAKGISDHVEQDGGHMTEKARQIYIRKLKEQVSTK